jgi:hypothetical protein
MTRDVGGGAADDAVGYGVGSIAGASFPSILGT